MSLNNAAKPLALVTGATGFVGSAVARRLLAEGFAVRVLARPKSDRRNLAGLDLEVAEGDLTDAASLARACAGCEALFHVAADYRLWVRDKQSMLRANVDGSVALMKAAQAAGVRRIVYTSSVAVLGHADGPADENTTSTLADMVGIYKQSKFLAEEAVKKLVREEGLPVVIVNPSTPIGPRDVKPTPTGRIIVEAARGRMPAYVDTGLNLVHVDDVADGHLAALDRGAIGERYILGGQNVQFAEMLAAIAALVGRRAPRLRMPRGPIMPIAFAAETIARFTQREPFVTRDALKMSRYRMFFTTAKAERALGITARPFTEALADAIAWFRGAGYIKS